MAEQRDNTGQGDDLRRRLRPVSRILWAVSIVLAAADVIHHRHVLLRLEEFPAFYGLYAFIACAILVFGARALRAVIGRREGHYDA